MAEVKKVFAFSGDIPKRLSEGSKAKPPIKYLVICLFAGHGILKDGQQQILINEYDKKSGFYKLFMAEERLRAYARVYSNCYSVGVFACCRQLYDEDIMSGFVEYSA